MLLGGQINRWQSRRGPSASGDGGAAAGAEDAVGAAGAVAQERQRQLHAAAALPGEAEVLLVLFGRRHGGVGRRQARDLLARARRVGRLRLQLVDAPRAPEAKVAARYWSR